MEKLKELFDIYVDFLIYMLKADISILTTTWVWTWVFPVIGYAIVMLFKWSVITIPIWAPIRLLYPNFTYKIQKSNRRNG